MDVKYAQGIFGLSVDREVNWQYDKLVSFSQFAKYRKCPRSWELHYVRKKRFPDESIHLVYGTAMHTTIQMWLHTCYTKRVKDGNAMDLHQLLLDELKREYMERVKKNNGEHFSSKEELGTFWMDGCAILDFLKRKRTTYFSSKNTKLMAIELPMIVEPDPDRPNIRLQSHLDLIFYDTVSKKYTIIDLKTSTRGWGKKKRKDKNTTDQLVLYKKLFCDKFGIDPKQVDVVYFILRQKIDPDSLWPIKRVSEFKPSNGNVSMNRVIRDFDEFLNDCFDEDGQYKDKKHPAIAGKFFYNCRFCPYDEHEDLCPKENRITEYV